MGSMVWHMTGGIWKPTFFLNAASLFSQFSQGLILLPTTNSSDSNDRLLCCKLDLLLLNQVTRNWGVQNNNLEACKYLCCVKKPACIQWQPAYLSFGPLKTRSSHLSKMYHLPEKCQIFSLKKIQKVFNLSLLQENYRVLYWQHKKKFPHSD